MAKNESIKKLLNAESIAVIGASDNLSGYGGRFMNNLIENCYPGKIYPVNPNRQELLGMKCYPSISDIGEPVDLAAVIVKANMVEDVVKECAENHVGSILIITAGFSEFDKENGPLMEQRIRDIARKENMRIIGPNCLGFANVKKKLWACSNTSMGKSILQSGHVGIVSQSGATGFGPLLNIAKDRSIGIKYIVSTGNETDLGLCDITEYMIEDDDIKAIALLIEGIRDGAEFIRIVRKAKQYQKALIILKIGESEVGARAAASHTAAMTGDMEIINALTKQYGVLKAEDYDELLEMANIMQNDRQLTGKRLAVISHSGGIGGFTGDQLGKYGFEVPVFSEKTQNKINGYLKDFGSPRNPLDLTGQMRRPAIIDIMRTVDENEQVDGFVVATAGPEEGMNNVIQACKEVKKPVYLIWTGSIYHDGLDTVRRSNIPFCFSIQKFAKNLSKLLQAYNTEMPEITAVAIQKIDFSKFDRGYLNEAESKKIISLAGITIPEHMIIKERKDLENVSGPAVSESGYVMKVLSRKITHKSDEGGVILNLRTRQDLERGFEVIQKINERMAGVVEGVLLEKMCPDGLDLVLGIRLDKQFGPVIMLGLGGIYTELFKLVNCRLLPLGRKHIEAMLYEIPGVKKLLEGYRGQSGYDKDALYDAIEKISNLAFHHQDSIELIEINPLRVMPLQSGVYALDCVIKIR